MSRRRSRPPASELGFALKLSHYARCVRCGRQCELPERDARYPMRFADKLIVNSDRCAQCGATRVQIIVDLE